MIMITAEEMAEFCRIHNTGSGMTRGWTEKHFKVVEKQLYDDEEVLFAFVGLYNFVSASKHENNHAIAITDKRIIAGQKKLFGEKVSTIQRKNLNDIQKSTGIVFGTITIDTYKEKFNIATIKEEIDTIHQGVNNILQEVGETKKEEVKIPKTNEKSDVEKLKEYKELLDLGIITEEEFNKKKEEIFG